MSANGYGTSGAHTITLDMVQPHLWSTNPPPGGFASTGFKRLSSEQATPHLLPQLLPGTHLCSWVDWSSVSKVSCLRKQQQHQSGLTVVKPITF